jgi:hypothetical protein
MNRDYWVIPEGELTECIVEVQTGRKHYIIDLVDFAGVVAIEVWLCFHAQFSSTKEFNKLLKAVANG